MNPFFPHTFSAGLSPGALSRPAGGIVIVQSPPGVTTDDGSAGLTGNFGVPVTAGNSVFAFISHTDGSFNTPPETTDGVLASLTQDVVAYGVVQGYVYHAHNLSGGQTGVYFALEEAQRASMQIIEVSGLADAAAEDTAADSATADTLAIGTITPTSPNNLLVAIFAFDADSEVVTPPAGWTLLDARQGGASVWQYVYYKIQTSAVADNPTIVLDRSVNIAGAAAAFGGA